MLQVNCIQFYACIAWVLCSAQVGLFNMTCFIYLKHIKVYYALIFVNKLGYLLRKGVIFKSCLRETQRDPYDLMIH